MDAFDRGSLSVDVYHHPCCSRPTTRFGSQTFARTGDRHEGIYHKNQRHGLGTYVWSNGDKYVGNWRHGKVC